VSTHYYDRVKETTTTAGTGAIALGGAQVGYRAFAVVGDGNDCYYCVAERGGGGWEVGLGTYAAAGNALSRNTVLASSNGGAPADLAVGIKDVFLVVPAAAAAAFARADVSNTFSRTQSVVPTGNTTALTLQQPAGFFIDAPILDLLANDGATSLARFNALGQFEGGVVAGGYGVSSNDGFTFNSGGAALGYANNTVNLQVVGSPVIPLTITLWSSPNAVALQVLDSNQVIKASIGANGSILVSQLVARQSGGGAGTDEVQVSHDGTSGTVESKDGDLRLVTSTVGSSVRLACRDRTYVFGDGTGFFQCPSEMVPSENVRLGSAKQLGWSSSTVPTGASADAGLARAAPAKVRVTDGSSGNGTIQAIVSPVSMADSAAANGTLYFSTTANKLVYKDAGGVVNALY
jgi:hypothetical protein